MSDRPDPLPAAASPAPRLAPARRRWRSAVLLLAGLVAGLMAPLLAGLTMARADGDPGTAALAPTQTLQSARWSAGPAPDLAHGPVLALPDDWGQRGQGRLAQGHYRLDFEITGPAPQQPWALWTRRLPTHHRVWLNGTLVSDTWNLPDALQPRTTPYRIALPVGALHAGGNNLQIDARGGRRGGLDRVTVGPEPLVSAQFHAYRVLVVDLLRVLNGMAAGSALFMLLLWARRRSEVELGWFGLLTLVFSVRNLLFSDPGAPAPPGSGVAMFLLMVSVSALFGCFGASLQGAARRPLQLAVIAIGLLCASAALWTGGDPVLLDRVRTLAYPLLFVTTVPAAAQVVRTARRWPQRSLWALAATVSSITACGLHDYLLQSGRLAHTREFLLPWTAPILAMVYAMVLGSRLVSALQESERAGQVLEQRVRERTAALEEANAAKSRFLAAASHDLRQPMVTIGVLVGLLREQPSTPAQQRLIGRVDEAVAAMEGLLAGLLDLSRLESGGLRVAHGPVSLHALIGAIAAHEQEAAARRGLQLRLRIPLRAHVLGDALLLEQIVRNLVSNALRYTERGGVLVAARRWRGGWRVAIYDTGRGIPPAEQARVFEDFVQLENPQRERAQGLGLGLAIVRRASALMGAAVQLRSVPGRGSCFSLALPAIEPQPDLPSSRLEPPGWTTLLRLQERQVWLVEDDPGAREALLLRLRAWGARVLALASPAALDALLARGEPEAPALLITDMRLPGGSGLEVVERVRQACGPVPALVVTGNTAPEDLARLQASGLPVVHKPFRTETLASAIFATLNAPRPVDPAS